MQKRTLTALISSLLMAVVALTVLTGTTTGSALADDGVGTSTPGSTQLVAAY